VFKYYILNLIAAPGVVAHELSHAVSCVLAGVRIHKIKLFQFGNPAGYVEHEVPEDFMRSFVISYGPLIFNSLLTLLLFSRFKQPYISIENFLILWLGIVIGLSSIPSMGDTEVLWKSAKKKIKRNPFVLLGFPLVLLLYLLNILKKAHIHFIYTAVLFWLANVYLKG
jgi:hypothetical protein